MLPDAACDFIDFDSVGADQHLNVQRALFDRKRIRDLYAQRFDCGEPIHMHGRKVVRGTDSDVQVILQMQSIRDRKDIRSAVFHPTGNGDFVGRIIFFQQGNVFSGIRKGLRQIGGNFRNVVQLKNAPLSLRVKRF
jgi:hypothetical protein